MSSTIMMGPVLMLTESLPGERCGWTFLANDGDDCRLRRVRRQVRKWAGNLYVGSWFWWKAEANPLGVVSALIKNGLFGHCSQTAILIFYEQIEVSPYGFGV